MIRFFRSIIVIVAFTLLIFLIDHLGGFLFGLYIREALHHSLYACFLFSIDKDIQYIVWKLKRRNIGVLITDHNVEETLCITDRAYMLFEGQILFKGRPDELAENPIVKEKYLTNSFVLRMKDFEAMDRERNVTE